MPMNRSTGSISPEFRYRVLSAMTSAGHQSDLRNSVRFPLHLHTTVKTTAGEFHAQTTDISSGGMMFHLDSAIEVGALAEIAIEMPAELLGTSHPIHIVCKGRVVRCLQNTS